MTFARLVLAIAAIVALSGCSSPDERAHEFGVWASTLEYVASVDASPKSGTMGSYGMSAHLVIDGAIGNDELVSLAESLRERAASQGISSADINLIVGNAWGFSVDEDGVNVATINELRDTPLLIGATVWYEPLDYTPSYTGGVRGTVGSQAALRDAPAVLLAAYTDNGGDADGVSIAVSTADGAFGIIGEGDAQPDAAIQLWQAISARVLPLAVQAVLSNGAQRLEITVDSVEDKATAEDIGARYPDVTLTVTQ